VRPAWAIAALAVMVTGSVASELFVLRQNAALREQLAVEQAAAARRAAVPAESQRSLFAAGLVGRCRPFHDAVVAGEPQPLAVAIYFSLDHDCLSCVKAAIGQWNDLLRGAGARRFRVTGYTEVDGAQDERILTAELQPAFPVVRIVDLESKLQAEGVGMTPAVVVSDGRTGRILFASAPTAAGKNDRSFVERMESLATPCPPRGPASD
jgi:hypothetical protein